MDLLNAKIDRGWEARKAVSQARRTPRRPDIYAYVQDLGIELRKKITTTILSIIIVLRNKIYSSYLFWLLFRQNKIKNQPK